MARKGLGKGLDSLIPDFYNEDFDSNSPQSLEDMLNENEDSGNDVKTSENEESPQKENIFEQIEAEMESQKEEVQKEASQEEESVEEEEEEIEEVVSQNEDTEISEVNKTSEDNDSDIRSEESVQTSPEVKIQEEHIAEVKQIVDKNPRITLWSSRSSAVFRYLRKTEPEFSISKEASILIEEAVSKKYPEIWALFEDL
ncbi:AAA family ATPase [Methanobrevibacter sp.]|uniref:AAA family ATPase n=1 Tax=Methanobrevibacter sp. TaxID=66852 RepID=UPI0025F88569|nr:AAA family ATPase [Methanobrevibacter sp.]MEE0942412.1 AAA family ATPase [Methanobrevibacter sp.]